MLLKRAQALLKTTHPIPSIAVASFAVLFAFGLGLPPEKLVLVGLAVLTQQFSVGLSNDWLDSNRDRSVGRTDKPAASGQVPIRLVRNLSLVSGAIAIVLSLSIGQAAGLLMLAMLAVGWSYNLGLKSNGFSVFPYAAGFGMLPIFVTFAFDPAELPSVWVILTAGLLGVSAHFANALPDLLEDKQTGVRALPHVLGQRISAVVISATAVLASILVVSQSQKLDPTVATVGLLLTTALALGSSVLALQPRPPRIVFHLLLVASLVNVFLLMLG